MDKNGQKWSKKGGKKVNETQDRFQVHEKCTFGALEVVKSGICEKFPRVCNFTKKGPFCEKMGSKSPKNKKKRQKSTFL